MCQLLGMNCNVPTDICFSFQGFCERGGVTDDHRDGWGIAFFEGRGCRLLVDDRSSITSPVAELVRKYPIRSTHVIAHIRKATQGKVALENCHPFRRELWGRYWVFAHNGDLQGLDPPQTGIYQPVGRTDSERAFCIILNTLRQQFSEQPSLEDLYPVLNTVTQDLASKGIFNYLLANGEYFFAHCSTQLSYLVRKAPFAPAHLVDRDLTVDFAQLTRPTDQVAIIATAPLTDNETWTQMQTGELQSFREGLPLHAANGHSSLD